MKSINNLGLLLLGMFLAIGLVGGGYFIGQTMYNAKVALNTAEAKGLAERRVKADRASWSLGFNVSGNQNAQISALYERAEQDQKRITEMLKQNGFSDDEISIGIISVRTQEFRDKDQKLVDSRNILSGVIEVSTSQVGKIAEVRAAVNKLIAQGVNIDNRPPRYLFTKLNDIKPAMLKEAAGNARIAANEFAQNAGANVGAIRSARQGSFFIRDAGEEYGDDRKIEKDVRVVTTITFYLTD